MEIKGYLINGKLMTVEEAGKLTLLNGIDDVVELMDRQDHQIISEAKAKNAFYSGAKKQREQDAFYARKFLKTNGTVSHLSCQIMDYIESIEIVKPEEDKL